MDTTTNYREMQTPETVAAFVACAIEVPLDEAVVPEVTDQLFYLYGFDCYARWRWAAAASFPLLLT